MLVGVLAVRWLLATEPEAPAEGMRITMLPNTHETLEAKSRAKHIEARLGKGWMPSWMPFVRRRFVWRAVLYWGLSVMQICSSFVTSS